MAGPAHDERYAVRLVVHVHAFVEQPMAAQHVAVVGGIDNHGVVRQAQCFQSLQNPPHLIVDVSAVAPIVGDDPLPVPPGQMAGVPAEHLLLLNQRLARKGFVEVDPSFHRVRVVQRVVRSGHAVGEMRTKERSRDHEGAIGIPMFLQPSDGHVGGPGFLHVHRRQRRTSTEGGVASPFQPLHLQCPINVQPLRPFDARMFVIVRERPEAPVTGVVTRRQMPLANVMDHIAGPGQQLRVADPVQQLPVKDPVEVAHVGQQAVVVGIQSR